MKRRLMLSILALLLLTAAGLACGSGEAPEKTKQPAQGVSGKVEIWEGNFMPMVDPDSNRNSKTPAAGRIVRLHEPFKSIGSAEAVVHDVPTPLVAETTTDENGEFYLPVEPGSYSIFVEEENGWYFNGWSGDGVQGAVKVNPGENAEMLIKITTNATF